MKIATITCHDVYNYGASLQAYALQHYLESIGHNCQIIDYKPDYLSNHYNLRSVANPRFDKPMLRQLYLMAVLTVSHPIIFTSPLPGTHLLTK